MGLIEISSNVQQSGEGCDRLSALPSSLSLKVASPKPQSIHVLLSPFLHVVIRSSRARSVPTQRDECRDLKLQQLHFSVL